MVIPSFLVPHYIISLYGVGTAVRDRMPRLVLEENQDGGRISDGSFIEGLYFYLFYFISPYWSMAVQMVNCIFPLGLRSSGVKSRGRADV